MGGLGWVLVLASWVRLGWMKRNGPMSISAAIMPAILNQWCLIWSTVQTAVGNKSAPIQLAQCRFRGLAISDAKILIYFCEIY